MDFNGHMNDLYVLWYSILTSEMFNSIQIEWYLNSNLTTVNKSGDI